MGHLETVRVTFSIVKMSQKMLKGKVTSGQMANKVWCLSGNILEHLADWFYICGVFQNAIKFIPPETNLWIQSKNSNYNENTSIPCHPYFCVLYHCPCWPPGLNVSYLCLCHLPPFPNLNKYSTHFKTYLLNEQLLCSRYFLVLGTWFHVL